MTIMEALQWANKKLKTHLDTDERSGDRLDTPMLDAEVLLADLLEVRKSWLFSHFDQELRDDQLDTFRKRIERRLNHEPVAYITGKKAFYGRDFKVNTFTLIPRPATETLVEEALRIAEASEVQNACFADIGTGSGAIAVSLAVESGNPTIATDIDAQSLTVAKANAQTHGVAQNMTFLVGDLLDPLLNDFASKRTPSCKHLILCANLPYLTSHQWKHGQKELHHEPRQALDAGRDGLDAYWALFRQLTRHRQQLPERVHVLVEIDPSQTTAIQNLIAHDFPKSGVHIEKDLNDLERVAITEI